MPETLAEYRFHEAAQVIYDFFWKDFCDWYIELLKPRLNSDSVETQKLALFTSDPFPLSAALVIDQGMSDLTLKKVNQTFGALGGSFGPFDEVAVFTYGNTVNKRSDFGNSTRMEIALNRIKDDRGQNSGAPLVGEIRTVGLTAAVALDPQILAKDPSAP